MTDKVNRGDKLRIKAGDWNDMLDAKDAFRRGLLNEHFESELHDQQPAIGQVLNDTGVDLPLGSVLGICHVLHDPATQLNQFKTDYAFCGRRPKSEDTGRFLILKEPLRDGYVGECIVDGIAAVRVDLATIHDTHAEMIVGTTTHLQGGFRGSARIVWKPLGVTGTQWCYVRLGVGEGTTTTTTTTTTTPYPDYVPQVCTGRCKYVWSSAVLRWIPESNTCSTTTTTTPAPTDSGAYSWDSYTWGAYTFASYTFFGADDPIVIPPTTTTTTAEPGNVRCCTTTTTTSTTTTTTTPAPIDCLCLYPVFCGEFHGECTYTFCAQYPNAEPDCGQTTTTAAPTTTTTPDPEAPTTTPDPGAPTTTTPTPCDCATTTTSTTTPAPVCDASCQWVMVPAIIGGGNWQIIANPCDSSCPCPFPESSGDDCAIVFTPCTPTTTTQNPNILVCEGNCVWYWFAPTSTYYFVNSECNVLIGACQCAPPSSDGGAACGTVLTPCVWATTTTQPPVTTIDPCAACYTTTPDPGAPTTTTTTPAPTTTTSTTLGPCEGRCKWSWSTITVVWSQLSSSCASQCPCAQPAFDGQADCEIAFTGCGGGTITTTTPVP